MYLHSLPHVCTGRRVRRHDHYPDDLLDEGSSPKDNTEDAESDVRYRGRTTVYGDFDPMADCPTELMRQVAQAVTRHLLEQPYYKHARSVACYLSMGHGELRTNGIVDDILSSGKTLYTPYLPPPPPKASGSGTIPFADQPKAEMKMLRLYSPEDLSRCPLDKWGILDPGTHRREAGREAEVREDVLDEGTAPLDLILLPGVAFDAKSNRLGRGKAYYDNFLHLCTSSRPSPLLIALALTPQMLPVDQEVPMTDTDFQLDGVLSPHGMVWRTGAEQEKVVKLQ